MKKSKLFSVAMLVALIASLFAVAVPVASAQTICGTPQAVTLFAGQTIEAGTVTVSNDENNLYVAFTTANEWLLSQTHLHVADSLAGIPQTKSGNPKVGNFAYQSTHDPYVTTYTYTIPKSALSLDANNTVVIAAHAVVVRIDGSGNVIANETGWGNGESFVSKGSWAMYFQYTWQTCGNGGGGGSETETAFARGSGSNGAGDDAVTCFLNLDLDLDGENEFNRWGWTNGPLAAGSYSFELWAAAGKCDTSKGTLVGTVVVDYNGSTASVTFNTSGVYKMVETHLYVGSAILPNNSGAYTVAPGQYPTIHSELSSGVQSDSYTVSGLSGDIYVVAHATVAGF